MSKLAWIFTVAVLAAALPAAAETAIPDLRGTCVATFTLVTPASARDPRLLTERASEWTAKLRGWGARNVYSANARGFDATDLRTFFQSCEG